MWWCYSCKQTSSNAMCDMIKVWSCGNCGSKDIEDFTGEDEDGDKIIENLKKEADIKKTLKSQCDLIRKQFEEEKKRLNIENERELLKINKDEITSQHIKLLWLAYCLTEDLNYPAKILECLESNDVEVKKIANELVEDNAVLMKMVMEYKQLKEKYMEMAKAFALEALEKAPMPNKEEVLEKLSISKDELDKIYAKEGIDLKLCIHRKQIDIVKEKRNIKNEEDILTYHRYEMNNGGLFWAMYYSTQDIRYAVKAIEWCRSHWMIIGPVVFEQQLFEDKSGFEEMINGYTQLKEKYKETAQKCALNAIRKINFSKISE